MPKENIYPSAYPDTPPEWYWIQDLHDSDCFPEEFTFKIKFERAEVKRK